MGSLFVNQNLKFGKIQKILSIIIKFSNSKKKTQKSNNTFYNNDIFENCSRNLGNLENVQNCFYFIKISNFM